MTRSETTRRSTPEQPKRLTGSVVCGLGGWLPPRVVDNHELTARLDVSDDWIRSRVGVGTRHVLEPGTSTSTLAIEAGRRALASARTGRVDAVLLATTTPDRPCPATAPLVAAGLGLTGVAAFDLNAVCSGFVYGLAVADGLLSAGTTGSVLLIGADAFSTIVDPDDPDSAVIFGDGAGAVVLRAGSADEPGAIAGIDLGSDGEQSELIMIPSGGSRTRRPGVRPGTDGGDYFFRMDGRATFRQAVRRMSDSATVVLDRLGWPASSVGRLICHQANARILTAVADRMNIPPERVVSNIAEVGNTAAASIPLAMLAAAHGPDRPAAGERLLLGAFGAGLSWGSVAMTWPRLP